MSYITLPAEATLKPTKFEAHTSDEQLSKWRQLLELSELGPETFENTSKDQYFGVTYEWMTNAKQQWLESYDWRATEDRINSFPNYKVDVRDDDDLTYNIHFIALYSHKKDAVPITFLHGWPGSFLEFLDLLDVAKQKYPSANDLPYHIIVPSIPGYGFSSPMSLNRELHMRDVARLIDKLMHGLGFGNGYITQGGDTGSVISRYLAARYPSCKGAHLNMCIMRPPPDIPAESLSDSDKAGLQRMQDFEATGSAYAFLHRTRPATIGFVISSNPLALLAWVGEKFLTWSDQPPPLESILSSASLYWFTRSFPTGIYHYRQFGEDPHCTGSMAIRAPKVFGYSSFPKDLFPMPRAWVDTTGNLAWYRLHEDGGHFAAMEKPSVLFADVEEFVACVWPGISGVGSVKL